MFADDDFFSRSATRLARSAVMLALRVAISMITVHIPAIKPNVLPASTGGDCINDIDSHTIRKAMTATTAKHLGAKRTIFDAS